MKSRIEDAVAKKSCGSHSCSQAIVSAYADVAGIDEDTARNVACAFSAGMGNMEGTCGALTGAAIVLGLVRRDKARAMGDMRQIMTRFKQRNGATQCRLLKGADGKLPLRACNDCVADAAEFLDEALSDVK